MFYTGWPTNVNKIILDSTSISVGNGATVKDSLESGGLTKSRLVCSNPPDKFQVVMDFDFSMRKYDNYTHTELDLFWIWYKNKHKYGTVPFQFPAILVNSNRVRGTTDEERNWIAREKNREAGQELYNRDNVNVPTEFYVITSAVEGSKSGNCQRLSMTWETFGSSMIQVEEDTSVSVDNITAKNGYIDIKLSDTPVTEPTKLDYAIKWKSGASLSAAGTPDTVLSIISSIFDGDRTVRYYFKPFTKSVPAKVYKFMEDTSKKTDYISV